MKLCTYRDGTRDGALWIASRDGTRGTSARAIAPTLQAALDDWDRARPLLEQLADALERGEAPSTPLDVAALSSPLPRAFAWIDGSAYINHIVLVRKARGALPPATLETDPLVYQGGSDAFLGPREPIPLEDTAFGCDFESEVAVITGDVPQATTAKDAGRHIRLLMLCNDVSLRNLIPEELAKGFGFFVSKPSSAFSPFAVTPDELGDAWRGCRVHLPLVTRLNGERFGDPDAGPEMHFSFADLIAHVSRTRPLRAGTIVGSGTVSNVDRTRGSSCLAERRMLEVIDEGAATTPFLAWGDRVQIDMHLPNERGGGNVFGTIDQIVARYVPASTDG
jgi:fumarylacetoacetate (FAA) hydrolase